jgi:hypothetical protein
MGLSNFKICQQLIKAKKIKIQKKINWKSFYVKLKEKNKIQKPQIKSLTLIWFRIKKIWKKENLFDHQQVS